MFPIVKVLKAEGYDITVLAPSTGKKEIIISEGFGFIELELDRKGVNPLSEIKTLFCIHNACKSVAPAIIHNITIKPIIYGSLIAKINNIHVINTVCGLGYSFIDQAKFKTKLALLGYKKALNYKKAFHFFENKDDRDYFFKKKFLSKDSKVVVVNGVGADLVKYSPSYVKVNDEGKVVVTMASRMIWEKGVKEFVEASKILYNKYEDLIEFRIYGRIDTGNPSSISENYLSNIEIKNYIKWYGFEDDMFFVFENSDIITLPSYYREGCPMVLMEACAMGIPVITTNSIGCRECVDDGVNGFMIPVKSSVELAKAIEKLILSKDLRLAMGKASRLKAESEFDQRKIVNQYLNVFNLMMLND